MRDRLAGIVINDTARPRICAEIVDVKELQRILGVGLVEPMVAKFRAGVVRKIEANLADPGAVVVTGGYQLAITRLVVAAAAIPIVHSISPVLIPSIDRPRSRCLTAVAAYIKAHPSVRFVTTLIAGRTSGLHVDESETGAVPQSVGSRDDRCVLDKRGIDLAEHGIEVEPHGRPVLTVRLRVNLAPAKAANVRIECDRIALLGRYRSHVRGLEEHAAHVGRRVHRHDAALQHRRRGRHCRRGCRLHRARCQSDG